MQCLWPRVCQSASQKFWGDGLRYTGGWGYSMNETGMNPLQESVILVGGGATKQPPQCPAGGRKSQYPPTPTLLPLLLCLPATLCITGWTSIALNPNGTNGKWKSGSLT